MTDYMGYISVNALIDFANNQKDKKIDANDIARFLIADVQEVKYGKWIKDERKRRGDGEIYDYCCSLCKSAAMEGSYGNCDMFTPFCPNCGAKMSKENNNA